MTPKPRSERSRWVTVFTLPRPGSEMGAEAQRQHDQALAVVKAFEKVGRVVRVGSLDFGTAIVLKARRP